MITLGYPNRVVEDPPSTKTVGGKGGQDVVDSRDAFSCPVEGAGIQIPMVHGISKSVVQTPVSCCTLEEGRCITRRGPLPVEVTQNDMLPVGLRQGSFDPTPNPVLGRGEQFTGLGRERLNVPPNLRSKGRAQGSLVGVNLCSWRSGIIRPCVLGRRQIRRRVGHIDTNDSGFPSGGVVELHDTDRSGARGVGM